MKAEALTALADRVEREEPSFELDSTIYEDALPVEEKRRIVDLPAYTTSLDAHVRPEGDDVFWRSGHDAEGPDPSLFKAEVLLSNLGRSFKGIARTEAMARRAAELRARAADMQARPKTASAPTEFCNEGHDQMNTTAKTLEELVARAHAIRDAGSDVLDLAGFWPLIEVAAANLPAPDYTAMSGPELLHTCRDDGHKWATAFCQHAKKQGHNIDHGWMVGWFANAIEHSHDVRTGGGPLEEPRHSRVSG